MSNETEKKEPIWHEIDMKAYRALFVYYRDELTVYSSFTDTEGFEPFGSGKPHYETAWMGKGKGTPILKAVQTKESIEQKEWDSKFFINLAA